MAERELTIVIEADDRASAVVSGFNKQLSTLQKNAKALVAAGAGITAAGGAIAFGLAKATKEAISQETAFIGVRKTVDATEAEFRKIADAFKKLSQETPITFQEMSKIGEIAGQLGVKGVENITKFSKVIALIGPTTELSTEQAAITFARFSQVMGTSLQDVDRLGATIVDLGNNFAANEVEISEFASRLSGAGTVIGLSESDVLGLSAAMAAVGIKAQAGGTALSRAFAQMADSIASGTVELDSFAKIAGVSTAEFAKDFGDKPISAIIKFTKGLARIDEEGGNVFAALRDVGFISIRQKDAFLRLAFAGDLLSDAVETGAKAWEENTALVLEAEKRFASAASQIQILQNTFANVSSEFGEVFLPLLVEVVKGLKSLVNRFQEITPETKRFIGFALALVSAFLLISGAIVTAVGVFALLTLVFAGASVALLPVIGIAAAVAAAIIGLGIAAFFIIKNWDAVKAKTIEVWEAIGDFLLKKMEEVIGFFSEVGGKITALWTKTWDKVNAIWEFALLFLKQFAASTLGLIVGIILTALDFLIPGWKQKLEFIKKIFTSVFNALVTFIPIAMEFISSIISEFINTIKSFWEESWNTIRDFLFGVFNAISEFLEPALNAIKSTWEDIWGGIKNFFFAIWDGIQNKIGQVISFIEDKVATAIRLINKIKELAGAPISAIGGAFSGLIARGRAVTGFANGGIVTKPTLGLLGENGAEAVIPLNRGGLGGANIVVNINAPVFSDDADRLGIEIGDKIIERLGLNIRIG